MVFMCQILFQIEGIPQLIRWGPCPYWVLSWKGKSNNNQIKKQYGFGFRYIIKEEINMLKLDRSWVDEIKGVL